MDNIREDAEFKQARVEKSREFKQHLNDSVPDRPTTRRQQERLREALHEQQSRRPSR